MWWTPDRMKWYERASEKCNFHKSLASCIEKYLSKDESILELGCGLGRVSAILAENHPVTAVDIDPNAVECAERREKRNIYMVSDWKTLTKKADCVLCIFFGHLEDMDNLSSFFSLSHGHVISVYSEHRGQREDLVLRKTAGRPEMEEKLRNLGYTVRSESIKLMFPQPLESMEEAEAFISLSYPEKNVSDYLPFVTESGEEDYPYVLKNEKRMLLFDIRR